MKNFCKKIVISIITFEAQVALKRHSPKIIAVTGNVGKTSTKDAIYAVVSRVFNARKSQKSWNSDIGLPLAILGLENAWSNPIGWIRNIWLGAMAAFGKVGKNGEGSFPEWLVLEVGADHPGDIEKVSKWLHPDIVVLTRMSDVPVHLEFFENAGAVLAEKMFLVSGMKKNGVVVVNCDDLYFEQSVKDIDVSKVFYGRGAGSDVVIAKSEVLYDSSPLTLPLGQYVVIRIGEFEVRADLLGVIGNHLMYSVAAAAAVAKILKIESEIANAFKDFETPRGRMRVLKGKDSSIIIDDTYNSSPLACSEALKTLGRLSIKGRKIAALADMKELGSNSEKSHIDIGRLAAEVAHTLVTVGEHGNYIAKGAIAAGMAPSRVVRFDNSIDASVALSEMVRSGDVVLVKGSQSMRMERVSKALISNPSSSQDMLVRQEREWDTR